MQVENSFSCYNKKSPPFGRRVDIMAHGGTASRASGVFHIAKAAVDGEGGNGLVSYRGKYLFSGLGPQKRMEL
ncbi:hypothetical protein D3C72_2403210 [compost metagenome]